MKKYKISELRRIKEYKILFSILRDYHVRALNYENDGKESAIYFTIPKANFTEMNKRLKESGLVFRILE